MHKIKSKYDIFKQKAHIIIYGTSTKAGLYFDLILLGLILLSVLLVMMETVTEFDFKYHAELVLLDARAGRRVGLNDHSIAALRCDLQRHGLRAFGIRVDVDLAFRLRLAIRVAVVRGQLRRAAERGDRESEDREGERAERDTSLEHQRPP